MIQFLVNPIFNRKLVKLHSKKRNEYVSLLTELTVEYEVKWPLNDSENIK